MRNMQHPMASAAFVLGNPHVVKHDLSGRNAIPLIAIRKPFISEIRQVAPKNNTTLSSLVPLRSNNANIPDITIR
jgi:hypothetical protein